MIITPFAGPDVPEEKQINAVLEASSSLEISIKSSGGSEDAIDSHVCWSPALVGSSSKMISTNVF